MRLIAIGFLIAASAFAQLTPDQRLADFQQLAGLFDKNYAPYEWKLQTQNFDLLSIAPWVERVKAARSDLDFFQIMVEYVASLNDAHAYYSLPSNFSANLNFGCDIYDGKALVESINRTRLPADRFPFQIGWEVVSIDRVPVQQLLDTLEKHNIAGNPRSTRRAAAILLTSRPQSLIPHAPELGESAAVVMRRPDGGEETYQIPWVKSGLPLWNGGPLPVLASAAIAGGESVSPDDDYMAPLRALRWSQVHNQALLGVGARAPIFGLPAGFNQRLGRVAADAFYSGTFEAGGYRIGYIRIPTYAPSNVSAALSQFLGEVQYFQQNTDGLVVDEMRNFGGDVGYANLLTQMLMPQRFRVVGFEIRATSGWILQLDSALAQARAQGAEAWQIDVLSSIMQALQSANSEMRGRTGALPIDDLDLDRDPWRDAKGNLLAYSKPLMVLVDEFSASAADMFAATIQMNHRGPLFGMRTMGAGGIEGFWNAGFYSESTASITVALMNRGENVTAPGYPSTPYIENVGVQPDIAVDYMTRDNLLNGGRTFVDAFVKAMVEQIRNSQ